MLLIFIIDERIMRGLPNSRLNKEESEFAQASKKNPCHVAEVELILIY